VNSKLALLDRDGTLIEHIHYLCDPEEVRLLPGTLEGLWGLKRLNFRLVMVSNQSGVGRGYFDEQAVQAVNARLQELLRPHGVELELLLYCPHSPEAACGCRKPATGMAEEACRRLGASLEGAIVVGDSDCDMELARALGLPGYRVGTTELADLSGLLHQLEGPLDS
jgi:D-glycero-D-manno-heptose 1,7-bisphosphate phosphatase